MNDSILTFDDCVTLRNLALRQTLTIADRRKLDAIASRIHATLALEQQLADAFTPPDPFSRKV